MKKKSIARLLIVAIIMLTVLTSVAHIPYAYAEVATGEYLSAAQARYKVDNQRTIVAETPKDIELALKEAGQVATKKSKFIVYVPSGTYTMTKELIIPAYVILVGEQDTVFTTKTEFEAFFKVFGDVYGGKYECKAKLKYGLLFGDVPFENGHNGQIEYTDISEATNYGIVATSLNGTSVASTIVKANINYNTISKCGKAGISVMQGAWVHGVYGNTIIDNGTTMSNSSNGAPGISLGKGNINKIVNNVISGNTGHGISTDVDGSYVGITNKKGTPICKMNQIYGNEIADNGYHGVFLDKNCYVATFVSDNNIYGNNENGLTLEIGARVELLKWNDIHDNGVTNVVLKGKNATLIMGSGNTLANAGYHNLLVTDKSYCEVSGKGNSFYAAKGIGISVDIKSKFICLGGKNNSIGYNGGFGLRVAGESTADVKNMKFVYNNGSTPTKGSTAAYVKSGCTIKYSGTNLSKKKGAAARLVVE